MSFLTVFSISLSHLRVSKVQCCYNCVLFLLHKLVLCSQVHNCCGEPGDCCCVEPCNPDYQIQDCTKGILSCWAFETQSKIWNADLLRFHIWLLSKIISNLGFTIVFSAMFVQFQPLLFIAYEHSEIFTLFIHDHSDFTVRILPRGI